MIHYHINQPVTDAQLRPLYGAVGWSRYLETVDDFGALCRASQTVVTAWDQDRCVGLTRTVGDGQYVALIQDLLVLPDYQGQGIGTALLDAIRQASRDYPQVFLLTDSFPENQAVRDWYSRRGLTAFEAADTTGFLV